MKKWVLLVSVYLILFSGISQISYDERVEFELKDGYSDEVINLFGENGFIISSKKDYSDGKDIEEWKFEKFLNNLKSDQSVKVILDEDLEPRAKFTNNERIHTIYTDRKFNFAVISVDAATMEITKVFGKLPKKFYVFEMVVLGDYVIIKGILKRAPTLCAVNWKTGTAQLLPLVLPNNKPKKNEINAIQVMEAANEVFIYVNREIENDKLESYVLRFNANCELESTLNLTPKNNKSLKDITASKISDEKYIFTGTYSSDDSETSEGVFFCQTDNFSVDFIKFHSYVSLEKFLTYLPKKKQEKIEKKKNKQEAKGEEFTLNYRLATHDIIPDNDGYIFIGEAFYPTYRTETRMVTTFINGRPSTSMQTVIVFDGYQYTHAMVCKFDNEGNILWDQIFEMFGTYKPYYVKKFISVDPTDQNAVKLVYTSNNKITTKSFDHEGGIIFESQTEEIRTNFEGDKSKYGFSEIEYWYDNYFIAYGNQKIKNEDKNDRNKKTRNVYFINKIRFE